MQRTSLICLLFLALPGLALAQGAETKCTYGDKVRRVVITSEPGVSVPCEVHYYKDTEAPGSDQVLWSASQQAGYCEEKATAFVTKLEGWGWNCGPAEASVPAAPEEPPAEAEPAEEPEAPAETAEPVAPAEAPTEE